MDVQEMSVRDAFLFTATVHRDARGFFTEWFKADELEAVTGRRLDLRQMNVSVSSAGSLRGIHFAEVPPSQAKYVGCLSGAVLDVVVDIRVGSPTFGQWDSAVLKSTEPSMVFVSEGLGHAFLALTDEAVVGYLCSEPYAPGREHGINPLDPAIGISWPDAALDGSPLSLNLSDKDSAAPTLAEAEAAGLLPSYDAARAFSASLTPR